MPNQSPYILDIQDLSRFHRVEAGRFFLRGQTPFVDPYIASTLILYHTPTLAEFTLVNTSGNVPFVAMRGAVADAFAGREAERVFMQRIRDGRDSKPAMIFKQR